MNNISLVLAPLTLVIVFILSRKVLKDQMYLIGIALLLIFLSLLKCDLNLVSSPEHICMLKLQTCSECLFSYVIPISYGVVLSGILSIIYIAMKSKVRH